jgi:hypothetical protein
MIAIDQRVSGSQDDIEDFDWLLLGEIQTARGHAKDALVSFERAYAAAKKRKVTGNRARLLVAQAAALRALGDARAVGVLETAVKEAQTQKGAAYYRGAARFALAQAINDPTRARSLAEAARRDFAAAYARGARELPAVDAWLNRSR